MKRNTQLTSAFLRGTRNMTLKPSRKKDVGLGRWLWVGKALTPKVWGPESESSEPT